MTLTFRTARVILLALCLHFCFPSTTSFAISPSRFCSSRVPSTAGTMQLSRGARRSHAMVMQSDATDRRDFLLIALALCQAGPQHALAFTNRIGELSPNRQGVPYGVITPTPRGVGTGGKPLRGCPSTDDKLARPPPNCFSSADPEDNGHFLAPWTYKKDPKEAWADVLTAVMSYKPGQGGIDGGGWEIVKQEPDYIYVQYQSEKIGYLDDLEFVNDPQEKRILVRSSSRAGFLDFGVNSKRLNYFILSLKGRGFKADAITAERFPDYFKQNMLNVPSRIVQSDPIGLGSRVFTEGDGVADTTPYYLMHTRAEI